MDNLQAAPLTINLANAALVAGTTTTYTTTVATLCAIAGKFATSLGAQTNTATPTLDAATGLAFVALAVSQACCLLWGVNNAGAIRVVQGPIVPTELGVTTTPGAFIQAPQFPAIPDDFCPIGYSIHRTSPTGSVFLPGTTAWAASGITSTFRNISTLPGRPQIA